ncbi:DeoR/GlpR family DNA-binding transcription regulator [Dyadobacter sp. CY323]|uniref:DeoR/GlpR family DNA-binding transcription regulator n=1 Tax=Dyadobacter sp. CY323 TaxID=2907302 RepID=UPI001F429621|nr:DeoR/GlpR family DNA-binding transcription regulator [Dyadobacter sp. CY323]MCE6987804.1 DeoR/GlpR family DNA-binding transcription regulator [Dyadobacter sp. CY323]
MNFQERKREILNAIYNAGSLSVFELADILNASAATIRRDLHEISEEGLLVRTHGGAMKPENTVLTSFTGKATVNNTQKESIAVKAAETVNDGDTLFLDCGSTVFLMCRYLKQKQNLRVITNSLPILAELIDTASIQINLIGGELDKTRKAIHGEKAVQHIDGYHAHKAFIGVDGISAENGLTAHSEHESSITTAFIRNAGQVVLLCDSTKIGKDSYIKFAQLSEISYLITDQDISKDYEKKLLKGGLKKIITA